jgi:RNA-binding protein Musashi
MFLVAHLVKASYVLSLSAALFLLLRPNLSHGQIMRGMGGGMRGRGAMRGMGGGMMGQGGGMSPLQLQLLAEFGAVPVNGMNGGMMGMGGGGMMMGMGGMSGGMMGQGGSMSPLQMQLMAEFGAMPVNGMGGMMMGFAGKNLGGFNGGNGL